MYNNDPNFVVTYQQLHVGNLVSKFHLQDEILCHLGHLYAPLEESEKLFWKAHYTQVAGNLGVENIVVILQNQIYWLKLQQDVGK